MTNEILVPEQSIWYAAKEDRVEIIDQRFLPHRLVIEHIDRLGDMCTAIAEMHVRGAPLIGVAAAYGMYLACREDPTELGLEKAAARLKATRPTAVNLSWAVDRQIKQILENEQGRLFRALETAREIETQEIECSRRIGQHGLPLIREIYRTTGKKVNILTHCNAGWLACVRYGTATAPLYAAQDEGIPIHVWVDETRPRNQGARLTAWELGQKEIDHTVIVDNAGGHLMQRGLVDLVIVGSDRTTGSGDVANKIGTYLKALAAHDNGLPFYVALPSSTIDWTLDNGVDIPIEQRDPGEVRTVQGLLSDRVERVLIPPIDSPAANYAFDVTPSRLVTALITEQGICPATRDGIAKLFPNRV